MVDQSRRSPLHYAVEKGLTRIVQVVDGVGDYQDDGESNDDVDVVKTRLTRIAVYFEYDLPVQCLLIDAVQMMNNLYISRPSWRMEKPILRGRIETGKR